MLKTTWPRGIYTIALSLIWLVLVIGLWQRFYAQRSGTAYLSLSTGLEKLPDEMEWMNIKMNGRKVGYSYSSISNLESGGYKVDNHIDFNTVIVGMPVKVTTTSRAVVDSLFRFRSFDWQINSGLYSTRITGEVEGDVVHARRIESNDTIAMELPIPREAYPSLAIKHLLAQRGISEGDRLILPIYEPLSQESIELLIEHLGKAELVIDSLVLRLNKIRINYGDLPSYLWLDDDGVTWREEGLMGMVLERTDVSGAIDGAVELSGFDIADFYAVPVEGRIINPREITRLDLGIDGLGPTIPEPLKNFYLRTESNGERIFRLSSAPVDGSTISLRPFLWHTALIQSDHPQIIAQARQITTTAASRSEQIDQLVDWVFSNLAKVPVANLASAYEILNKKVGDCSEHTTLFTALSRSLGIPTRVNMGVVYLDGQFLYHAWPSVLLDNHWIAVDPTFGQHIADATHVSLLEGDFNNLTALMPLLGQIKMRIIEYK